MNTIPDTAIKVFKFVTENYQSPGFHGNLDYSPSYPKTITEPNCDPKEKGQCAKGIHVIPMTNAINWQNVIYNKKIIAGYVLPEHIIFSESNGKMRVSEFTVTHEPTREEIIPFIQQSEEATFHYTLYIDKTPTDETRTVACKKAEWAYYYARDVDQSPTDETRTAACKQAQWAHNYARYIDKASSNETRTAACKDAHWAHCYARDVDQFPTDETRTAACKQAEWANFYALDIDKASSDETRTAACQDAQWAYRYARDIDKAPTDETRTAACQEESYAFFYAKYADKAPTKETWEAVEGTDWERSYLVTFPNLTKEQLDSL